MSHTFTKESFRREYLQRVAEGEMLPKWLDSTAVSMLIQQMNKPRKEGCDFGEYSFYDIKWSDFLSGIFSLEERIETNETGLQIKVIDEQSCYDCLKHFIEQIKKPELKISIMEFLLKDEFRREVLEKDYDAYRNSSHMIQEQCAIVLGDVNRAIQGFIAPDLANLPDDYGEKEEDTKTPNKSNKVLVNINGQPHVLDLYYLPTEKDMDIIKNIIDSVNDGSIQARKADWKILVQTGHRISQNKGYTFDHWLQENLTDIRVRDYRVDALHTIIDNLPDYLQEIPNSARVINRYKNDCNSLIHYFRTINFIIPYYDEAGMYYSEHRDDDQFAVEAYIYYQFIERLEDISEYVAFTQAHYEAIKDKTHLFIPQLVAAKSQTCLGVLTAQDIIEFCRSLYMAETTRQKYLHGWDNESPLPTIHTFPLKLRNRCFDFYINHCYNEIFSTLSASNKRLHLPDEKECLEELLKNETQAYNRLKGMENFRGSIAFAQTWKQGTPDILAMADLFLQYLQERINNLSESHHSQSTSAVQSLTITHKQPYCTYSVPDAAKTRDEIEADLVRASQKSAKVFCALLIRYEDLHYLDFRGETVSDIYEYLKERYSLTYEEANFLKAFKQSKK